MKVFLGVFIGVLLGLRASSQPVRSAWIRGDSIPPELEVMYRSGLNYLAQNQTEDGCWTDHYGSQPGVVGVAVLSFLAHGEDPNFGPYRQVIQRAVSFILSQQDPQTGYIGNSMYNHGFATLALAEAYGQLQQPDLGLPLRRAVDLILESQKQNPQHAWRYSPTAQDADTTVSGAQMVALFAARNAGLEIPDEALEQGLAFFAENMSEDGGIGYTSRGAPNSTRTAIASLSHSLYRDHTSEGAKKTFGFLREQKDSAGSYVYYHFYYMAQALFHGDMDEWRPWNREIVTLFKASQQPDGSWSSRHGQAFGTGAALLTLALNYRLMPIYER